MDSTAQSINSSINQRIAHEIGARQAQVVAAIDLLDGGATVPFIARYRKEVTDGLDDGQLRTLEDRLRYLRELEQRREAILASIQEQGKLTPELTAVIKAAETKTRLEDLYLPFKVKRRTKGQIAREAGLEPLADALLAEPTLNPDDEAKKYLNGDSEEGQKITDVKAALDGAKFILMEKFAENAELVGQLRDFLQAQGQASARLIAGKESDGGKFRDYFEYDELLSKMPSHRALAIFRGRNEGVLSVAVTVGESVPGSAKVVHPCEAMVAKFWGIADQGRAGDQWLKEVVHWTWQVKLLGHLETDLLGEVRERAEQGAIQVFADNLKDLLLAAPAGQKATIGLDPGLRTGVKVAVVDGTGKVLDHCAIFPTPPQKKLQEAEAVLLKLCQQHNVGLIAIGNGTGSRETEKFVKQVLKSHPQLSAQSVMVNEAGASIYSASEFAAQEFPELDVTVRGAISIARRLQDPLAELVKIDPKSIGVGQYQHDVSQVQLARSLDVVVEDCVNAVGVDVNTASAPLLARVSGLSQTIANNIVEFRDSNGAFVSRTGLKAVPRLGAKTYEQAAGFLRIVGGKNPLDGSAVHPESYAVVKKIAQRNGLDMPALIGNSSFLRDVKAADYVDEQFGLPTVIDIISELDKPGRDPRPEFKAARFQEGVEKIGDLQPGMVLEGVITNVTHFGAFVDIGVHQDGLVHISALSNRFVKDPREVVKAGDVVKVKVLEVDAKRQRIGMTMRLDDELPDPEATNSPGAGRRSGPKPANQKQRGQRAQGQKKPSAKSKDSDKGKIGSMGLLLQQALKNKK